MSSAITTSELTTIAVPRHTVADNLMGLATGTFIVSLGLALLKLSHTVTGGTAGLALLVAYATGLSFGVLYFLVNLPFLALALWKKGASFTLRSLVCIAAVSALASLHPWALGHLSVNPVYAALAGNLLAGVGMLILFRHGASLGGINVLALLAQERLGLRAGYVQMAFDIAIILAALTVVPAGNVALSAVGAVVLNLVLAMNHRPGRYLAA